jgi:pyruvate dehydrogenase E1 component beta subunit
MRASVGAGLGFGLQHSRTLEQWLVGTPGLKVVSPSDPQTAYGLLRAAIQDDNPVAVLEPRALYAERGEVTTGDDGIVALGTARTLTRGTDVTVVTLGQSTGIAAAAAAGASWSADHIDLCTLVPWDRDAVFESVGRTGRLVVVEQSPWSGGWGTEIVSAVTGELFGELSAPPIRITCPDVPVPFNKHLEARYLPTPEEIDRQITELLDTGRRPLAWWERTSA